MFRSTVSSFTLLALSLGLVSACASHPHTVKLQENTPDKRDTIVALKVDKIRARRKRFDVHFLIKNNTGQTVIVKSEDIACYRGTFAAEVSYNTASGNVAFDGGEERGFNIHCSHQSNGGGDYKVTIARVYDNPTDDHETPGKVIVENVSWSSKEETE